MLIDYISNLERVETLCDEFASRVEQVYFNKGGAERCLTPNYYLQDYYRERITPVKSCVELYRILEPQSLRTYASFFYEQASFLESSDQLVNLADFKFFLGSVKLGFTNTKREMLSFYSAFDEEEKERMNEAIHNYLEQCNYSCVAMSVSAIESRLLKLMCLVSPDLEPQLEKKTLGQLITDYIQNKGKYKDVVPEKHEPLLQLCNTYRTFSVHPKKQKIQPALARSILSLSILFLTDQDTKPEVVKAQLIVKEGSK